MIPPQFPVPRLLVVVTGVFEIAGAAGLFITATRRAAAFLLGLLMVAVFPANIYVAGRTVGGIAMPSVGVRLAMQVIFLCMVLLSGFGLPRMRHGEGRFSV